MVAPIGARARAQRRSHRGGVESGRRAARQDLHIRKSGRVRHPRPARRLHVVFDNSRIATRLNFYDGIYRWLDNPPQLKPWLAESHTISPDGLTYTFKLKPGAKFHDGTEITADDVVYSIERIIALNKGPAALFTPVIKAGSTKALDKHTVAFNLSKPAAIFLSTVPEISIVNSALVKKNEKDSDWGTAWLAKNDAGSGSFKVERYDPAVGVVGVRFADHFAGWEGLKPPERIELRTIREQTSQLLALKKGDVDALDGYLPADQIETLRKDPKVQIMEQPSMRLFVLHINNQRPPFDNVHVRRAISYAFDYSAFIKDILHGTVDRNPAPVPKNLWGYPEDAKGYEFDIVKAKEELAKSGVKFDRPVAIHTLVGLSQSEQAATIMQSGLRQLGIESKIVAETWPTLAGKAQKNETTPDIWTNWISTFYADPNNWVGEMYNSRNWGTWKTGSWYKNPKVDALLDEAYTVTDKTARERAYQQAAEQVVEDAASVFIYNTKWYGPFSARVKSFRFSPVGNGTDFRWASVE